MRKLGTDLLSDLQKYKDFQKDAGDFLDELHNWQSEAFADWSRDVLAQIDDPNHPLRLVLCIYTVPKFLYLVMLVSIVSASFMRGSH